MPITNNWDETFPPDSEAANLLANNQRKIQLNIRERLEDTIYTLGSLTASAPGVEPVVRPEILGNVTGSTFLHHSAFKRSNLAQPDISSTGLACQLASAGTQSLIAPFRVRTNSGPAGVLTITNVDAYVDTQTSVASFSWGLNYITVPPSPTLTTVFGGVGTKTPADILTSGTFAHTVLGGRFYYLVATITTDGGGAQLFYGINVIMTISDCRVGC